MTNYEIYRYIFYGGAILAAIMLIISVLLFFLYRIPNVIGDLTGANARKAIENIRNQNESTGDKLFKSGQVNRERGKLTDKMTPSGNLIRRQTNDFGAMATEKLRTQELIDAANETTVLGFNDETTVLGISLDDTTVLGNAVDETTVLQQREDEAQVFEIEYDITYTHTDEVIA